MRHPERQASATTDHQQRWGSAAATAGYCSVVGLGGLEPPASPLSGVRSNHLSYRPNVAFVRLPSCCCLPIACATAWWSQSGSNRRPPACKAGALPAELWPPNGPRRVACRMAARNPCSSRRDGLSSLDAGHLCGRLVGPSRAAASQKEVIQPHLPIRLPCYDFTPVMNHSVASAPLAVRRPASGATHSHGVTGGVYKARERIHRSNADLRLLAIPTSWSRVADSNPD